MIDNEDVKSYLSKLSNAESFNNLDDTEKDKAIFTSKELLYDYFSKEKVTTRAIALQVLYDLEGEEEEFARLKRHGVKSYSVKGVSVTFEGSGISQDVIRILSDEQKAKVKRLI